VRQEGGHAGRDKCFFIEAFCRPEFFSAQPGIKAPRASYQFRTLQITEGRCQTKSKISSIKDYKTSTTTESIVADS
jgi:hypothetical protein